MKNSAMLLSFLFILLASTEVRFSTANSSPEPVLDIDGNELRTDVNYYILPVLRGKGGGLTLGNLQPMQCPLNVVQEPSELMNGLPATFMPVLHKKGMVPVSTNLYVQFQASTTCATSTVWKLVTSTGQEFVTIGGRNPGAKTVDSWFKIEKLGKDYKFVFCPTVCHFCKVTCGDVGSFFTNGKRALALSKEPLAVKFKKV